MRQTVDLGDRKVTLVGTAHVSEESRKEVEQTIEDVNPDFVGVELDSDRFDSLKNDVGWKNLNVAEAISDGKGSLLLFNLILSIYQRKIGLEEGVKPGSEMLAAVESAEEKGIEFGLLDRNITETFERLRSELSLWEKSLLLTSFIFEGEDIEVDSLQDSDIISTLVEDLEDDFPSIKKVFLDERNQFMVDKLLENDFDHAVVVVGAAHVEGIVDLLESKNFESPEIEASGGIPWFQIIKWGMPLFIIAGIGYSFYQIGFSTGINATGFWILSNGILAMLGAIIARSHPLTWIVSFLAAPLTSLDPALGAGMVASYFEAKFYPPKVGELETIAYIQGYRELWSNQVGRILLTFALVSAGSAAATFISAGYIISIIS